jgi:hypothetical protein
MKFLKSALLAAFVISLAASCSTYRSCPAYADQQTATEGVLVKAEDKAETLSL